MASISADTPDDELVKSLRSGHQDALGILYDRYGQLVYAVALRIVNRPDEAEDLTQEIFLQFWKKGQYQPERGALGTYLTVITRSQALNRLRSRGSRQRAEQRLQHSGYLEARQPCPLEQVTFWEQQQVLQQAMTQLPDNQKQILVMNYLQGMSQSTIAAQLNLPLGTVKTHARQGLRRLREILGDAVSREVL